MQSTLKHGIFAAIALFVIGIIAAYVTYSTLKNKPKAPKLDGKPSPIVAALIAEANKAYNGCEDLITRAYDKETNSVIHGVVGDTLADYIAAEIVDVGTNEKTIQDAATQVVGALETAINQLNRVHEAMDMIASGDVVPDIAFPTAAHLQLQQNAKKAVILNIRDPYGIYARAAQWTDLYATMTQDGYAGIEERSTKQCALAFFDGMQSEADFPWPAHKDSDRLVITSSDPTGPALIDAIKNAVDAKPETREGHGPDVAISCKVMDATESRLTYDVQAIQRQKDGSIVLITNNDVLRLDELDEFGRHIVWCALKRAKRPKPLSTAFEVTPNDVAMAFLDAGRHQEADMDEVFEQHIRQHTGPGGRIEQAALHGDDLDQQTHYAQEEIGKILREAKVL